MDGSGAKRRLLARDAQLDEFVTVLWSDCRDGLQLVLSRPRVMRPDLVACLDSLYGDCAVICLDRCARRETFRAGQPRLGVLKQPSDSPAYTNEEQIGQYAFNMLLCGDACLAALIRGLAVTVDHQEALKWFRRASEQGNGEAQFNLGVAYYIGDGMPKNLMEAYKWMSLSDAQGVARARNALQTISNEMSANEMAEAKQLASTFKPTALPKPSQ